MGTGGALGIGTVTAAAAAGQEAFYNSAITVDQLSTYTGIANDKMENLITNMADAHFPVEDAINYVNALHTLGVPNSLLTKNAKAMNEIQLGTQSTAATTEGFTNDVKELGGNVNDLTTSYGMAGYAQDKTVGKLAGFTADAGRLGPKLEEMGYTAQESTVIIAQLSQQYGGHMRGMMTAVNGAKGSQDALMQTMQTNKTAVDQQVGTFGEYAKKVETLADKTRNTKDVNKDATDAVDKFVVKAGAIGSALAGPVEVLGTFSVGIYGVSKALDKLGITGAENISLWRVYVNMWKGIGEKIVDTIRGWAPSWRTAATKSEGDTFKALDDGVERDGETFVSRIKNFGGKVTDTVKGWAWGKSVDDDVVNMYKDADGTWKIGSDGFIGKVKGLGSDVIKTITDKLPSFKGAGKIIPDSVSTGITDDLPKLLGKTGGPLLLVTSVLQVLSGAGENWHTGILQSVENAFGIDAWKGIIFAMLPKGIQTVLSSLWDTFKAPFKTAAQLTGLDKILQITPEDFWGYIFGKDAAKKFGTWLNNNISGPINHWFLALPGEIVAWASGVPGAIEKPFQDAGAWLSELPRSVL